MSELPKTVAVLTCPNGSAVYVVGTAHFSKESVDDVRKTIALTKPQCVVLELCRDREMMLHFSEEQLLQEARTMNFAKIRSCIHRDGFVAGITQSVFLKLSAELTEKLGVAPGGEFRAGYDEARKLEGCRVVLGDRLIGITFKRAMASLSLWQRLRFGRLLVQNLASSMEITPEDVEKLKDKDMVTMLTGELSADFPALSQVLVDERDQILAYSLMVSANCATEPYGPAVTVVSIMGMGHVQGVQRYWLKPVQVKQLMNIPQTSTGVRVAWTVVKVGMLGMFGLAFYLGVRKAVSLLRI